MDPVPVNGILEITIGTKHEDSADRFINRLRYRSSVEGDGFDLDDIITELMGLDFQERWWDALPSSFFCDYLSIQRIYPTVEWKEERFFSSGEAEFAGGGVGLTIDPGFNPALCAVVTRKTYKPGRAGIGHVYYGPMAPIRNHGGFLIVDPLTGGDMSVLLDFLGDQLTVATGTFKPCVVANVPLAVDAQNDIRAQYFAPKVVERNSRRPGIGQ